MPLLIPLRDLDTTDLHLAGALPAADLGLDPHDEAIRLLEPLQYDLQVQQLETNLLIRGKLILPLVCECVRCLKSFTQSLVLEDWVCHIPLEGEEKAEVTSNSVDLTPYIRDDIFLTFPRHPLCTAECKGLKNPALSGEHGEKSGASVKPELGSPLWAELNKLKL